MDPLTTTQGDSSSASFWYWQQASLLQPPCSEPVISAAVTTQSPTASPTTPSSAKTARDYIIKGEPSPPSSPNNGNGSLDLLQNHTHSSKPTAGKIGTGKESESCAVSQSQQPSSSSSGTTAVVGPTTAAASVVSLIKQEIVTLSTADNPTVLNNILSPSLKDPDTPPDCCTTDPDTESEFEAHQLTELATNPLHSTSYPHPLSHHQLHQNLQTSLQQLQSFRTGALELATLADLSGELAMSLSPKHTANLLSLNNHFHHHHHHHSLSSLAGPHNTPFSVTDILSPLEESYRLKGLTLDASQIASGGSSSIASNTDSGSPPSPYRVSGSSGNIATSQNTQQSNQNPSSGPVSVTNSNNLINLQTISGSNSVNHHLLQQHTGSVASVNSSAAASTTATTIGGNQSPVSSTSTTSSLSAAAAAAAAAMNVPVSSPYTHMHVPQLSHPSAAAAAFTASQYCNGADLHGMTGHYGDVRSSATAAGWYGASATDPRFASKLFK